MEDKKIPDKFSKEYITKLTNYINQFQLIQISMRRAFPQGSNEQLEAVTTCQAQIGFLFSLLHIN